MIKEREKKVGRKHQEPKKSENYFEKLENRGSVKCLIEISTFGI